MANTTINLVVEKETIEYYSDIKIVAFDNCETAEEYFKIKVKESIDDDREYFDTVNYDEKNSNYEAFEMGNEAEYNHYIYTDTCQVL